MDRIWNESQRYQEGSQGAFQSALAFAPGFAMNFGRPKGPGQQFNPFSPNPGGPMPYDVNYPVERMNTIIDDYDQQGLRLTGRQLYYQFVSRDWIPNTEKSYKNLLSLLADARYAGMVDWAAIEDRGRVADIPSAWSSIDQIVNAAINQFRLPVWNSQPVYAELWVEKQALAGVLEPLAREFRAPLMVNKGYSSASAMYEAANRIEGAAYFEGDQKPAIVFYLGDHDPSGNDMVRDIGARLNEFVPDLETPVEIRKLALTMAQIRKYNPPPNPAKTTDARFAAYEAEHGSQSWEVDALPPNVLAQIIRDAFRSVIDASAFAKVVSREKRDSSAVREAVQVAMRKVAP